jgi:hypothetical protein
MSAPPEGITLEANRDLRGRARRPWYRRALLCCVAFLPILALLNVFGQRPTTTTASSQAASLSVNAPDALRGGLVFQARVEVLARRDIKELEIVFDRGWWEAMTLNSIQPEPSESSSQGSRVSFSYGKLPLGHKLTVWLEFQVNPTDVGKRRENVEVDDNSTPLVHLQRSLTIFP